MNSLTISAIIPTYNRPEDLRRCLASILRQSRLPEELLIIDDGELDEQPLRQECEARGIHYVYHRKSSADRGLTKSRNLGVRMARGEIIFFLDDDVELFSDYIELIVKIYTEYKGKTPLGGVGGVAVERHSAFWTAMCVWLFQGVFLISPLRPGRVTWSGFSDQVCLKVLPRRHPFPCDILGGSLSSFHRRVFDDNYYFTENIAGYGQGEDKDFSYRVSRRYLLLTEPRARQYHNQSPVMRHAQRRQGKEYILATHRFFRLHIATISLSKACFWYAATGYFLKWSLLSLVGQEAARNRERLRGIREGLMSLLRESQATSQQVMAQSQHALKVSIIIPTYNRPKELCRCIASILQQERRADELVIIDDGELVDQVMRDECEQAGMRYIYYRKNPEERGLTKSRNTGVALSSGDIIVFLDDDVELLPDFLAQILKVYENEEDSENLGGVSGMEILRRTTGLADVIVWLFQIIFLLSPARPGRVTWAGFSDQMATRILPLHQPFACDIIGGGMSSYRRGVFDQYSFDEDIVGYGQGEDKDFSWRVSRRYQLKTNPLARVRHHQSPAMRHTRERQGEEYLLASYRFFKRYLYHDKLSRCCFLYAATGHLIKWSFLALLGEKTSGRRERLHGIVRGFHRIIRGECDE